MAAAPPASPLPRGSTANNTPHLPSPPPGRSGVTGAALRPVCRFLVSSVGHGKKLVQTENKAVEKSGFEVMEAICREATVRAIEDKLPSEIKGMYKISPRPTGNVWTVSFNCPYPRCKCYESKDRVQKRWTNNSTNPAHAAALAEAVLSKHRKCFDALRPEDCGEGLC
jgi:aspartate carbamoyltransferase regulatory subunit